MNEQRTLAERLQPGLAALYGSRAKECMDSLLKVTARYSDLPGQHRKKGWDQRDVVLICYADHVRDEGQTPLSALREFLMGQGLDQDLNVVHLLPFFPASSDDGFSVIDYRRVDPLVGSWDDVAALGQRFELMFDLVLNHVSRKSRWFEGYLAGVEPFTRFFVEADPSDDLSLVVRPRALPLLTRVETSRGVRHVWTTFSDDQIDLNYAEPLVLAEMLDVLLSYIRRGARIVRLDAVAFLWKQPGTSSLHLPQTHEVVKLLRDVVDIVAPGTILLTETNVPHAENVSYWGAGDEAQMVYNFSLPPLLLDALLTGDATYLNCWLKNLEPPQPGTSMLNFTASHDGVGVRPLESLVPQERIERLVAAVRARGGMVSARRQPDGKESPYELNITYFDALGDPDRAGADVQVRRFLASQALVLAMRGIPAIYFPSLFGAPNDQAGVARTGRARSINRRKFESAELERMIQSDGASSKVFNAYRRLLAIRIAQPAFHPDAAQDVLAFDDPAVVGFVRTSTDGDQRILVLANIGEHARTIDLARHQLTGVANDLIGETAGKNLTASISLEPYQVCWLPVASAA